MQEENKRKREFYFQLAKSHQIEIESKRWFAPFDVIDYLTEKK